jgi:predicted HAD superfamily Cof-like phosphohydrolase
MSARYGRVTGLRPRSDIGEELIGAADAIADMAQRIQLNGPEITYASEKLAFALYKSAEALALCGVELEDVITEVHRGYRHGIWSRTGETR